MLSLDTHAFVHDVRSSLLRICYMEMTTSALHWCSIILAANCLVAKVYTEHSRVACNASARVRYQMLTKPHVIFAANCTFRSGCSYQMATGQPCVVIVLHDFPGGFST